MSELLPADVLDQLPDLSAKTLLRAETMHTPIIPREEQGVYVEAARNGDTLARNALLENCVGWVLYKAHLIHMEYEPAHSDVMDLVGHANLRMLEYFPKALEAQNPVSYLMSVAAVEMRRYVFYKDPMIQRPKDRNGHVCPTTVSGDAGERPLFETLADAAPLEESNHDPLYQAIGELPQSWRESVLAHFGLNRPLENRDEIAAREGVHRKTVERRIRQAKEALGEMLKDRQL